MTAPSRLPFAPVLVRQKLQPIAPARPNSNRVVHGTGGRKRLGEFLAERGDVTQGDLVSALAMQARKDVRLGDILLANDMVSETDLLNALCDQWDTEVVDLRGDPPDVRLIDAFGPVRCLATGLVPWKRIGSTVIIATTRPEKFSDHRRDLEADLGPVSMALTTEEDLHDALAGARAGLLAQRAENRVSAGLSCRGWNAGAWSSHFLAGLALTVAGVAAFPVAVFSFLTLWAVLSLAATQSLKAVALFLAVREQLRAPREQFRSTREGAPEIARLPTVSVMVPLFREEDVIDRLIERLSRLTYPRELLDVLLVVEGDDSITLGTLKRTRLPRWIRIIHTPTGNLKTKPRALNYALDFCRGGFVGVWDAEDAPAPDQLHRVVRRFHDRGPEVACLQGVLDYYNPRRNWLSRCFTLEYASWFRVILPGLQKLDLPVPLGGTTLFFRREALEDIGGWDAHNVTEDADLGVRLSRLGYRTEIVETVTQEEANCRTIPWIRQRSRWLKGYAMTWAVHTRKPLELLRDFGAWRFTGFQILFFGTLSQFLLAPVLWSFWLLLLGLPHPLTGLIPTALHWPMVGLFVFSELINLSAAAFATRESDRRFLIPWAPTLQFYFPLATIAAYKAFLELLTRPFFWDKTQHGYDGEEMPEETKAGANTPDIPR